MLTEHTVWDNGDGTLHIKIDVEQCSFAFNMSYVDALSLANKLDGIAINKKSNVTMLNLDDTCYYEPKE